LGAILSWAATPGRHSCTLCASKAIAAKRRNCYESSPPRAIHISTPEGYWGTDCIRRRTISFGLGCPVAANERYRVRWGRLLQRALINTDAANLFTIKPLESSRHAQAYMARARQRRWIRQQSSNTLASRWRSIRKRLEARRTEGNCYGSSTEGKLLTGGGPKR